MQVTDDQKRAMNGGCWITPDMRANHMAWIEKVAKVLFVTDRALNAVVGDWGEDKALNDVYRYRAFRALQAARVQTTHKGPDG